MTAGADGVSRFRDALIADHVETPYYDQAEAEGHLGVFWGEESPYRAAFARLDLTSALELACGRGRHAERAAPLAGALAVTDPVAANIAACRARLPAGVRCVVGNGRDLSEFADGAFSAVYSYDAMVHFEAMDVVGYLFEIARVLRPGGRALLHLSLEDRYPERSYRDHPCWRNWFSEGLLRHAASRAGLGVLSLERMKWPPRQAHGEPIDGLALLERL